MKSIGYTTSEFLLTPLQFGIPNSRLRYYFLAKRGPLSFVAMSPQGAAPTVRRSIPGHGQDWVDPRFQNQEAANALCSPLSAYLDEDPPWEKYTIPDKILCKKAVLFDIVKPSSKRSCCFTRGYTHMIEGTTVLQMNENMDVSPFV